MRIIFLIAVLIFLVGCKTTEVMLSDYEKCVADPMCHAEIDQIRENAHLVTEGAVNTAFPSMGELAAITVSNIVAFFVGVMKGRKKKEVIV